MSESVNYPIDIVERTKFLLTNENQAFSGDFEVTFLMNCLLGILVAANEFDSRNGKKFQNMHFHASLLENIPETLRFIGVNGIIKRVSVENDNISWQIFNKNNLSTETEKTDYKLGWFLNKLRNGIAHQHIEAINTEGKWIGVKLWNENDKTGIDFIIEFSVLSLKKLTLCIADIYLTVYQSKENG